MLMVDSRYEIARKLIRLNEISILGELTKIIPKTTIAIDAKIKPETFNRILEAPERIQAKHII